MKKRYKEIIKGNNTLFREGDKIRWSYNHTLNSTSFTKITKYGVFIRYIVSNYKDGGMRGTRETHCFVQFKGNKRASKIIVSELVLDV